MALSEYAKKVEGKKKKGLLIFALSTCVWCKKTKKLLKDLGFEYDYIDVDLVGEHGKEEVLKEFSKWSPEHSFPAVVVDNKRCIIGFREDELRRL